MIELITIGYLIGCTLAYIWLVEYGGFGDHIFMEFILFLVMSMAWPIWLPVVILYAALFCYVLQYKQTSNQRLANLKRQQHERRLIYLNLMFNKER